MEGNQPLVVQAATAKKLNRLIEGVARAKLRMRPAPEKWSVSEIIAHLADSEFVGGFRLRFILGSPGAPVVSYDQDKWVQPSDSNHSRKPTCSRVVVPNLRVCFWTFPSRRTINKQATTVA